MDRDNVYYVSGKGFVVCWEETWENGVIGKRRHERQATDKEIGRALRTGRLYNTSSVKLINEIGGRKNL